MNRRLRYQHRPVNRIELAEVTLSFARLLIRDPKRGTVGSDGQSAAYQHSDEMKRSYGSRDDRRITVKVLPWN